MMRPVPIEVECHAGYKGDESPRSFTWDGRRHEIAEIVDRWYQGSRDPAAAACDYYRVRASEGGVFVLRLDRDSLRWHLVDAPPRTE